MIQPIPEVPLMAEHVSAFGAYAFSGSSLVFEYLTNAPWIFDVGWPSCLVSLEWVRDRSGAGVGVSVDDS